MSITAKSPAVRPRLAVVPAVPTVGVEEEFLLLDPSTGVNAPVADQMLAALGPPARAQSRLEFRRSMVEMVTPVCSESVELRHHLERLRAAAAAAAAAVGAQLVPVGATPLGDPQRAVPPQPRYLAMAEQYGPIAHDPAVCGCHVHVGVPDRELAIQVCNHLRTWLPVVQALGANSPFHAGADTGYASWRSVQLERWPSMGPTPHFASLAEYEATVEEMIASGVMLDESMVYWYARPSARYPTVEVRVGDVCATVDEAVLIAALIRALVATAIDAVRADVPPTRVRDCLLAAAHWRAAHDGVDGVLLDLRSGVTRPAWQLVEDMVTTVTPALARHGDLGLVRAALARLRQRGGAAARQRRTYRRTGDLRDVIAMLVRTGAPTLRNAALG